MLTKLSRHRTWFLASGAILALWGSLYSDPDSGHGTFLGALALIQGVWAVAATHISRKALFDYPEANLRNIFINANRHPIGSGLLAIATSIVIFGLLMVFAPRAKSAELPNGFIKYGPVLKVEQQHYWPGHPDPAVLTGLIEQESCISLKSSGCWNPSAKLKTSREEGAGMGQLTRAYRANGSERFDALSDLRDRYSSELSGFTWNNVYSRPDLQLRAIVLMSRDANKPFRFAPDMLAFGDAAYNGGPDDVQKERRACALTKGCDPGKWIGNVELHCLKSHQPLYGGRSACDINREHVRNAVYVRPEKYRAKWAAL